MFYHYKTKKNVRSWDITAESQVLDPSIIKFFTKIDMAVGELIKFNGVIYNIILRDSLSFGAYIYWVKESINSLDFILRD